MQLRATQRVRDRYNRIARVYDRADAVMERRLAPWRRMLWERVRGQSILEVGVGTGANIPYYPPGARVVAVDISEGMLERARMRAAQLGAEIDLRLMDGQCLEFQAGVFDAAVATLVFCSMPRPALGLKEMARVCRPGGRVVLLEHVRSANPFLGGLMDVANPLTLFFLAENINRTTVETARHAGLRLRDVVRLSGIFRLIEAET